MSSIWQIERDRYRNEIVSATGGGQVSIYRGDKHVTWNLDFSKKTWTETTRESEERTRKLYKLPKASARRSSAELYRRVPPRVTMGGWIAMKYTIMGRDGQMLGEAHYAEPEDVGITQAELAVFSAASDMVPGGPLAAFLPGTAQSDSPAGILIQRRWTDASGVSLLAASLVRATRADISSSEFEIPRGFSRGRDLTKEMEDALKAMERSPKK